MGAFVVEWSEEGRTMKTSSAIDGESTSSHDFVRGFWRLADPKISLASMSSIFLGACAAAASVGLDGFWLAWTVLGIFAIEVAKNASGEIFDYDSGTDLAVSKEDQSPFSGGKRVLVDGLLTREETGLIAAIGYAAGAGLGFWMAWDRTAVVLWAGLAGVLLAYQYHAPPLRLAYRGLGELAVALCYGPLIALGTYAVQSRGLSLRIALLAVPLGLAIAAFLWVNEFPDYRADKLTGKKTLVVRLGRERAAVAFGFLQGTAFLMAGLLPLAGFPGGILLGMAGVIPAAQAVRRLLRAHDYTPEIIGAQKAALLAFVVLAVGQGLGLLWWR